MYSVHKRLHGHQLEERKLWSGGEGIKWSPLWWHNRQTRSTPVIFKYIRKSLRQPVRSAHQPPRRVSSPPVMSSKANELSGQSEIDDIFYRPHLLFYLGCFRRPQMANICQSSQSIKRIVLFPPSPNHALTSFILGLVQAGMGTDWDSLVGWEQLDTHRHSADYIQRYNVMGGKHPAGEQRTPPPHVCPARR